MIGAILGLLLRPLEIQPDWGLLATPSVQRELHLGAVERADVAAAIQQADEEIRGRLNGQPFTAQIDYRVVLLSKATPRLREIGQSLSPEQRTRLIELSLQKSDTYVFENNPEVKAVLGIKPAQMAKIVADRRETERRWEQRIHDYAIQHHLAMRGSKKHPTKAGNGWFPVDTPETRQLWARERAAVWATIRGDLDRTQNDRLRKLLGRPFVF